MKLKLKDIFESKIKYVGFYGIIPLCLKLLYSDYQYVIYFLFWRILYLKKSR